GLRELLGRGEGGEVEAVRAGERSSFGGIGVEWAGQDQLTGRRHLADVRHVAGPDALDLGGTGGRPGRAAAQEHQVIGAHLDRRAGGGRRRCGRDGGGGGGRRRGGGAGQERGGGVGRGRRHRRTRAH